MVSVRGNGVVSELNTMWQTFSNRSYTLFNDVKLAARWHWFRPEHPVAKWSLKEIREDKIKTILGSEYL